MKQPTIKDLIQYLSQFPEDLEVWLDKDGWEVQEGEQDMQRVIKNRGIFYCWKSGDKLCFGINN